MFWCIIMRVGNTLYELNIDGGLMSTVMRTVLKTILLHLRFYVWIITLCKVIYNALLIFGPFKVLPQHSCTKVVTN